MICPKCGKEIRDGLTFCPSCGQELGERINVQPVHVNQPDNNQIEIEVDIPKNSSGNQRRTNTYINKNQNQNSYITSEKKIYQKTWFIIVMLIIFWPVGLFLMWKYTNWNKIIKIIISVICAITLIGYGIGGTDEKSNTQEPEALQETEQAKETVEETIYEGDETINKFIIAFNERYPDMALSSDDLSVYHHHGSDHEDQVWTHFGKDKVLVSSKVSGGIKVNYDAYKENDDVQDYAESNRRVFGVVMPLLNPELDEDAINQRWQDVLDDIINSPEWDDGISFSPGPNRDEGGPGSYEYFTLEN